MNRARTAQAHTAPILGTRQPENIAQHPKKRHARVSFDGPPHAVYFDRACRHPCTLRRGETCLNRFVTKRRNFRANSLPQLANGQRAPESYRTPSTTEDFLSWAAESPQRDRHEEPR